MKRGVFIVIIIFVIVGCKKNTDTKEYFVRPISVICDYPFNDTTKWAITCRVWGLLKYYHPNVTAGKLDWDKVLLDRIDKINDAVTPEQVNTELMQMIRVAGKYKGTVDKSWNDSLNMNVNLCWLDHSFINDTIKQELRKIASLTVKQPSYYVGTIYGPLTFDNEKDYDIINIISFYGYRLLALFRYWNVIYYFFPYKYLMDQPWDETLKEFIPQFMNAFDSEKYHEAVLKLTTKVNDGHAYSNIVPYGNSFSNITAMVDTFTVIRTPPENSLLKRGDIILSINGKEINTMRDSLTTIIPSSNRQYTNLIINALINKTILNGCVLTVLREQQKLEVLEYRKKSLSQKDSLPFYNISPDMGYVNLELLKEADVTGMFDSLENTCGIIFDLRNYPYGLMIGDLFCHLSSKRQYDYGQANIANLSHNGSFYIKMCTIAFPEEKYQECKKYNGKVAVLINAITMSRAEVMAMEFRIHGATLIGMPTAGANGNIAELRMPGGIVACFSSIGFYYPNGEEMQRKGIIPDIEVYPTMESIMEGKDEILEEAINYMNNLK